MSPVFKNYGGKDMQSIQAMDATIDIAIMRKAFQRLLARLATWDESRKHPVIKRRTVYGDTVRICADCYHKGLGGATCSHITH